jgi:hypothetical protein
VRRVTEIAEITGNKKPDLHPLYAWDSTNDTLTQLDKASYAKKQINKYSGLSMDKINNELKLREDLLAEAAKRKISSIGAFSVFLQKCYERQK